MGQKIEIVKIEKEFAFFKTEFGHKTFDAFRPKLEMVFDDETGKLISYYLMFPEEIDGRRDLRDRAVKLADQAAQLQPFVDDTTRCFLRDVGDVLLAVAGTAARERGGQ